MSESELKISEEEVNFKAVDQSETREHQKNVLTFEFEGQEFHIPYETKHFDYPEKTQKETGILGYERKIISTEALFNILKEVAQNDDNIDLEKYEITNYNSLIQHLNKESASSDYTHLFYVANDITTKLLSTISEKEYPSNTLNHIMGGHAEWKDKISYLDQFEKDSFFLQKIQDGKKHQTHDNYPWEGTLNKKGASPKTGPKYHLGHLNFIQNKFFLEKALSPGFGFDLSEPHMHQYISETIKEYLDSIYRSGIALDSSNRLVKGMERLFEVAIINSKSFQEYSRHYRATHGRSKTRSLPSDIRAELKQLIESEFMSIVSSLGDLETKAANYIASEKESICSQAYITAASSQPFLYASLITDVYLPILTSHDQIPQLRWGHAKYAHMFTSKGLNLLKFEHANSILRAKK